ncbi:MAG: hypothetical protein FJX77_02750, partial [Armatimonadetes bacterium]|nr:hypothetical protein [Armatimonadota bacterium]
MPRPYPGLILHRASSPTGALALGLAAVAGVALGLVVPRVGPGSPPPPRAETVRALAQTPGVPAVPAPVPAGFHRVAGNLAQNAGFEEDWSHRRFSENRRFLLLQSSDLGVGEQDGVPDHWRLEGAAFPAAWDTTVRRSGSRSLRLTGGARARQWVRGAGEQFWQTGGAYYQDFLPLARDLAVQLPRRPIVVGAWCRTEGASAAQPPRLQLRLECAVRQTFAPQPVTDTASRELSVPFTGGSHGWEYREVRFEPAEWPGTPQWIILSVSGPAEGMAWFDDVSCREIPGPQEVNRVANESFEQIGPQGWPVGWRRAERWTWFRSDYYLFTGWTHSENLRTRGSAVPDPWIAFSGHRSLRCTIYPGDNLAVASDPIPLDQDRPRPIELRAMVKADRLRTLELMAQDERGEWLLQGDFLGDDMEDNPNGYKMGSTGSGTYDWQCVRKFLSPRRPVRFLRVFLCARGFDGVRVEKNQVGTVWWDDIQVRDPGPGIGVPPPTTTPGQPLSVVDLQVGDRLWGRNELRVDLSLPTPRTVGLVEETRLKLEVTGPDGQTRTETAPFRLSGDPARLPAHAVGTVPYQVERLCRNWEEQYRLRLTLTGPGGTPLLPSWESAFGTPTRMLEAGVSASCLYPGETAAAYARLNVARDSLAGFENCRLSVEGPAGVRTLREIRDLRDALTPQSAPDYLDTSRLLQAEIREAGLPVRPWREPIRDQQLRVRLVSPGGRTAAEAESVPFGFMERVPAPDLPAEIRRTGLDSRGFLTVNDRPFFPVFWTPHFGILPEANYHPKPLGYQCVDLTQVVLAGNRPPD